MLRDTLKMHFKQPAEYSCEIILCNPIAEAKLQFSNKFVALGIMKTPLLFGMHLHYWGYLYYLLKSIFT